MITVEQWESGEVKLEDEIFVPVFLRPQSIMDNFIRNPLRAFKGVKTGTYIEPAFNDVLEPVKE